MGFELEMFDGGAEDSPSQRNELAEIVTAIRALPPGARDGLLRELRARLSQLADDSGAGAFAESTRDRKARERAWEEEQLAGPELHRRLREPA